MVRPVRAARYFGPRDVRIEEVPEPLAARGEVVLDVLRNALCGTDSAEWLHGPHLIPVGAPHPGSGRRAPLVMGHEFVGRVAALGDGVESLAIGQRVVCGAGVSCGVCEWCLTGRTNLCARYYTLGLHADGGLAEQVATPASICRLVPDSVSDDAASLAQPLAVALHAVGRAGVSDGAAVAVIGVGGIGAFVVAAAAARNAARIVAVDVDDERLETARLLGATDMVDARAVDVTAAIRERTGGEGAHVVIEASGAPPSPETALESTRRGGRVVLVGLQAAPREIDLFAFTVREVELSTSLAHVCSVDLPAALELLDTGGITPLLVGEPISLDETVDRGLHPLAEGAARRKIVVDPTR
jgi:threonine dehydrogenase-like Zn-dependent dehydrogenase